LPSVVFALAFILLGWIASHSIAYALVDLIPHSHHGHHGEEHIHGYMGVLKLAGGVGLVLGFALALRVFFQHGSFGDWLHEGIAGTRKQVALATVLPAAVFVLVEHLERWAAATGTSPSAQLLTVGVLVQLVVGVLCLALVRATFRVTECLVSSITDSPFARFGKQNLNPKIMYVVFARPPCPMADPATGRAPPVSTVTS
jgi:hypothetical protein